MNLEEAIQHGCPLHIALKMKNYGIVNFSTPYDLDNINWKALGIDVDLLIKRKLGKKTSVEDEPIYDRFEILDL